MNTSSGFSFDSLTQHYSIDEITNIFSHIDEQIMSLHGSSSSDFLMFHKRLKRVYNMASEIANNNASLQQYLVRPEADKYQSEFSRFYTRLNEFLAGSDNELRDMKSNLDKIRVNTENMQLPLKNFNQNQMTLKFLLANLRLNFKDFFAERMEDFENQTLDLDKLITLFKKKYPNLFRKSHNLRHAVQELQNFTVEETLERLKMGQKNIMAIHQNINTLTQKVQVLSDILPKLESATSGSFEQIDKIITKIQYHDIIRQKMEHIQATHKELIKELNLLQNEDKERIVLFKQAKYVSQIPYIAELQTAQLIATNREYQAAIETITRTFNDIHLHMGEIAEASHNLADNSQELNELDFNTTRQNMNRSQDIFYQIKKYYEELRTKASEFLGIMDDLSQTLEEVQSMDEKLQNLSESISQIIYTHLSDRELAKTGMQLKNLTGEIQLNLKNARIYLNHAHKFAQNLHTQIAQNDMNGNNYLQDFCKVADSIMQSSARENQELRQTLKKNETLSQEAYEELSNTLNEVHYYDTFEQKIEEIITELNTIYENLQTDSPDFSKMEKNEKLKHIRDFYTTQDERGVHDNITNPRKGKNDDGDEKDIEFF